MIRSRPSEHSRFPPGEVVNREQITWPAGRFHRPWRFRFAFGKDGCAPLPSASVSSRPVRGRVHADAAVRADLA